MLRSFLSRVLFRCDRENSESEDDSEDTFRPSELDASVLYAHGMAVERSTNDLDDLQEQAEELENVRENE